MDWNDFLAFGALTTAAKAVVILLLVVSLGIHEAAHAWTANRCGDSTAKDLGRLTLNPVPHIDPVMTILLPTILFFTVGFIFGGAKPVPVNPHRLRHPLRDMMYVAIAGPLSNLLLALFFMLVYKAAVLSGMFGGKQLLPILAACVIFNLILAIFNMIPVPPLDGSRVMAYLLPSPLREPYVALESMGMLIIFGMFYFGVLSNILNSTLGPTLDFVHTITGGVW